MVRKDADRLAMILDLALDGAPVGRADGGDEEFGPAGMRSMRAQNGVTGTLDIFFCHPLLAVLLT